MSFTLRFAGGVPTALEFRPEQGSPPVLSSPTRGGKYERIRWGDQVASLVLFLLHQALWVASDPDRAAAKWPRPSEETGRPQHLAPEWYFEYGSFVATAAEALNRPAHNTLRWVFGWRHTSFVRSMFPIKRRPPTVAQDCRRLSPLDVHVYLEDERVTRPEVLKELMNAVATGRGWDIEALFRPRPDYGGADAA